jgi:hypothetical protein
MPVFISYSHSNKEFVDKLAIQLVRNNVNVWVDRWELALGDSIVDRVQEAIDGASALLVILSKSSVASPWCNKELSAGFLRELEERRVVVLPVMLEDCDVPVFARGKLFADFRKNFDDGLRVVLEGIAKVTNPHLSRTKAPTFHTDWSVDWGPRWSLQNPPLMATQTPPGRTVEIVMQSIAAGRFFTGCCWCEYGHCS